MLHDYQKSHVQFTLSHHLLFLFYIIYLESETFFFSSNLIFWKLAHSITSGWLSQSTQVSICSACYVSKWSSYKRFTVWSSIRISRADMNDEVMRQFTISIPTTFFFLMWTVGHVKCLSLYRRLTSTKMLLWWQMEMCMLISEVDLLLFALIWKKKRIRNGRISHTRTIYI